MAISREELLKRGWSEEEIDYTFNAIDKADQQKSSFIHFLDGIISWFGLILVFVGSLILSVILMPFFLTVNGFFLYFMVFFLAFILGVVFNFLVTQINDVGKEEKILGEVFLPVVGVIDVYVMIGISNFLITLMDSSTYALPNSYLYGSIFVFSLSFPFYFTHFNKLKLKYQQYFKKKNNTQQYNQINNSANNPQNFSNQPQNNDYYEQYMQQLKEKEMRKAQQQERLKQQLMKRLGK